MLCAARQLGCALPRTELSHAHIVMCGRVSHDLRSESYGNWSEMQVSSSSGLNQNEGKCDGGGGERAITVGFGWVLLVSANSGFSGYNI